jgi:hypothetical protein
MIETTPWGLKPRHLLRDRDAVYGRDFRPRARGIGTDAIASPGHAPKSNAITERLLGTLRRERLDHLIVRNEHHLLSVLREFVAYHDEGAAASNTRTGETEPRARPTTGRIWSRPVLNGLHQVRTCCLTAGALPSHTIRLSASSVRLVRQIRGFGVCNRWAKNAIIGIDRGTADWLRDDARLAAPNTYGRWPGTGADPTSYGGTGIGHTPRP